MYNLYVILSCNENNKNALKGGATKKGKCEQTQMDKMHDITTHWLAKQATTCLKVVLLTHIT